MNFVHGVRCLQFNFCGKYFGHWTLTWICNHRVIWSNLLCRYSVNCIHNLFLLSETITYGRQGIGLSTNKYAFYMHTLLLINANVYMRERRVLYSVFCCGWSGHDCLLGYEVESKDLFIGIFLSRSLILISSSLYSALGPI